MQDIKIITGKKEDIPNQYLEQLFALQQNIEEEKWGIFPPEIALYRKKWKSREMYFKRIIWAIAVNSENLVIGYGSTGWNIKHDNLDRGWLEVYVAKEQRRKGVGKTLLKALFDKVPEEIIIIYMSGVQGTDSEIFLKQIRKQNDYQENNTISNLSEFNVEDVRKEATRLLNKAKVDGYKIVEVSNMKIEEYVEIDDFVIIVQQIWNDIPREELTFEDYKLTPEKFRDIYDVEMIGGDIYHSYLAIHVESNKPVGYTTLSFNPLHKQVAWQADTGVIPVHRGFGLGLMLKYQSLLYLLEKTDTIHWITGTASQNKYMIRINKILGHKLWNMELEFEFKKEELERYLNS